MTRLVELIAVNTAPCPPVTVAPAASILNPSAWLVITTNPEMSWLRVRLVVDSCPMISDPSALAIESIRPAVARAE